MKFISEQELDQAAEQLLQAGVLEQVLDELELEQPWLLAFLIADAGPALSRDELDHMMFLALVIWYAMDNDERKAMPQIQPEAFEEAEETIWTHIQSGGNKSFKDMLDPYFEVTLQEDVLSFIEDALQLDEESPVTTVGREPAFVRLKVMMDLFCGA